MVSPAASSLRSSTASSRAAGLVGSRHGAVNAAALPMSSASCRSKLGPSTTIRSLTGFPREKVKVLMVLYDGGKHAEEVSFPGRTPSPDPTSKHTSTPRAEPTGMVLARTAPPDLPLDRNLDRVVRSFTRRGSRVEPPFAGPSWRPGVITSWIQERLLRHSTAWIGDSAGAPVEKSRLRPRMNPSLGNVFTTPKRT